MTRRAAAGVGIVVTATLALATRRPIGAVGPSQPVQSPPGIESLKAVSALPAHVAAQLRDPIAIVRASNGTYLVLDRREHAVFATDAAGLSVRRVVQIGLEPGTLLAPISLSLGANDIFVVADEPAGVERLQYFATDGTRIGGFYMSKPAVPQLVMGDAVLGGLGAIAFTGKTFLVSKPSQGALFAELDVAGNTVRQIGALRSTGHESDPEVHLALNHGMPVVDPTGGFYFIFQTGVPLFRKYDAAGTLVFERHIEGIELDGLIQTMPTSWPRRPNGSRPLVAPLVRAAAADAQGRLWVSLSTPYSYVYSPRGDKIRTVQFHGAGVVAATYLFFESPTRVLITPGGYEFNTG